MVIDEKPITLAMKTTARTGLPGWVWVLIVVFVVVFIVVVFNVK
jgi:hypothetical protein